MENVQLISFNVSRVDSVVHSYNPYIHVVRRYIGTRTRTDVRYRPNYVHEGVGDPTVVTPTVFARSLGALSRRFCRAWTGLCPPQRNVGPTRSPVWFPTTPPPPTTSACLRVNPRPACITAWKSTVGSRDHQDDGRRPPNDNGKVP